LIASGTFFYSQYKDNPTALSYYTKARQISPDNPLVYETLGVFYMGFEGKCQDTVTNLTKALSIDPYQKLPYYLLYNTYLSCFNRPDLAKKVSAEFSSVFQADFKKFLKDSMTATDMPLE
jgi:hypothetical protein